MGATLFFLLPAGVFLAVGAFITDYFNFWGL